MLWWITNFLRKEPGRLAAALHIRTACFLGIYIPQVWFILLEKCVLVLRNWTWLVRSGRKFWETYHVTGCLTKTLWVYTTTFHRLYLTLSHLRRLLRCDTLLVWGLKPSLSTFYAPCSIWFLYLGGRRFKVKLFAFCACSQRLRPEIGRAERFLAILRLCFTGDKGRRCFWFSGNSCLNSATTYGLLQGLLPWLGDTKVFAQSFDILILFGKLLVYTFQFNVALRHSDFGYSFACRLYTIDVCIGLR